MQIEKATEAHVGDVAELAFLLWPDSEKEELRTEFAAMLHSDNNQVLVAVAGEARIGFIHLSLRKDYVEGAVSSPVGFVEGIYVAEGHRGQGVSRALVKAGSEWARAAGCRELASDTELHNTGSQAFHERVGFREAGRIVAYIKDL
ncbi:aminoglycoside 6'-N-acetyltransferase [Paenibacillus sp. 1P07SE]|uniref:aminoglycoside 6'-N-acetyltransferase n=1 Tax=Paenibacillus sp. 1P07SE TaxID=3132209 RepID=UPI0039A668AE